MIRCKNNVSLVLYFYVLSHVLSDVDWTALLHPDYFEAGEALKHVFTYFPERAEKRNFFNSICVEAGVPNVSYSIRNFDIFEIITPAERLCLDSL